MSSPLLYSESYDENEAHRPEDELIVLKVEKERTYKGRIEYWVHWEDGDKTWEPIDSLLDADGTENIEFVRYKIRKNEKEEAKFKQQQNNHSQNKAILLYVPSRLFKFTHYSGTNGQIQREIKEKNIL